MEVSEHDELRPTSSFIKLYDAGKCFKKQPSLMFAWHAVLMKGLSGYDFLKAIDMEVDRVSTARKQRTKRSKKSWFFSFDHEEMNVLFRQNGAALIRQHRRIIGPDELNWCFL